MHTVLPQIMSNESFDVVVKSHDEEGMTMVAAHVNSTSTPAQPVREMEEHNIRSHTNP